MEAQSDGVAAFPTEPPKEPQNEPRDENRNGNRRKGMDGLWRTRKHVSEERAEIEPLVLHKNRMSVDKTEVEYEKLRRETISAVRLRLLLIPVILSVDDVGCRQIFRSPPLAFVFHSFLA